MRKEPRRHYGALSSREEGGAQAWQVPFSREWATQPPPSPPGQAQPPWCLCSAPLPAGPPPPHHRHALLSQGDALSRFPQEAFPEGSLVVVSPLTSHSAGGECSHPHLGDHMSLASPTLLLTPTARSPHGGLRDMNTAPRVTSSNSSHHT